MGERERLLERDAERLGGEAERERLLTGDRLLLLLRLLLLDLKNSFSARTGDERDQRQVTIIIPTWVSLEPVSCSIRLCFISPAMRNGESAYQKCKTAKKQRNLASYPEIRYTGSQFPVRHSVLTGNNERQPTVGFQKVVNGISKSG